MTTISNIVDRRHNHRPAPECAEQERSQDGFVPASYFRWKGPLDRCLAAVLLAPGLPVIAFLVILVRLTSRGPGIYSQARVGKRGRKFMMYKVRTMRHDAEAASGPTWTQAGDPRITRVGKVLRRLHLDELPQLLNVIKGEMSLAGPRPERPEFVRVLAQAIPGYRNRLAVRPGVTGLAQLNLPPDTDLTSVRRKVVLDCEYIENAGLLLDFRLLLCTFLRIFKVPERWLLSRLRLGRHVAIPDAPEMHAGNGEQTGLPAEATPVSILLQIGDQPNLDGAAADAGDGESDGNGHSESSDAGDVATRHNCRGKRLKRGNGRVKPR
jgi:lipopolysaccharide/colanic/teichoic acid biosynthesis glycosyltransferase